MGFQLTSENYYSDIANYEYMSVSQFKDFAGTYGKLGCEECAMAKIRGKYKEPDRTALLEGSYVDSFYEGTLDKFKEEHAELFRQDGELKANFVKAEKAIARSLRDPLFQEYMSGEKQVIMTGELFGSKWKIKMDSYHPGRAIVDLKYMQSLTKFGYVPDAKLATSIAARDNKYLMPKKEAQKLAKQGGFARINIGVDFGGNGSGHSFVAIGETVGFEKLIVLKSKRYLEGSIDPETQKRVAEIDPEDLGKLFVKFVSEILKDYGYITKVYADSAEQVLIRGLKTALLKNGLATIKVVNALKSKINDRIFATTALTAMGRLYYTEECETFQEAVSMAVWNPKNIDLERLDDGTSDIDTLDAFECTWERDIGKYIKKAT